MGCSAWQDGVIPAHINEEAAEYSCVPKKIYLPYPSLWDAKRIARAINYQDNMDRIRVARLKGEMQITIADAEELKHTAFSPTGPLGVLIASIPGLTFGSYFLSKPSDKKKITELEMKINGTKTNS
jgi:hypothetical protein